jgi:hypothetical protein
MKAIVAYESLWGNTAAVARAIAEGLGPEAQAMSTAEATRDEVADADLIVAGAPVHGFSLPREQGRSDLGKNPGKAPTPPDLSHPSMRLWLAGLPRGSGHFAAFDTRFKWTPGSATSGITKGLRRAGYRELARRERFLITGTYGPMRDGELERAQAWGAQLGEAMRSVAD